MFRDLKERINTLNGSDHVHPLMIIDEAHYLANEILTELRLLSNFEMDSLNALTILLCGSEDLTRLFALSVLESLANSVTITISFDSLSQEETIAYIERRLSAVGAMTPLLTKTPEGSSEPSTRLRVPRC
jgi:type II secretory pathway predicted ATPase ExeA